MLELVGLLAAFIVIFALRFKGFDFALTIFIASGIVGLTAEKPYTIFIDVTLETIRDMRTWELCAAVAFITILGFVSHR